MLHCDTLLTFAAVTVEGFDQSREAPGELVRLVQVLAPTFERLLIDHRASVALHSGVMARDRLTDQHSLERVARLYVDHRAYRNRSSSATEQQRPDP